MMGLFPSLITEFSVMKTYAAQYWKSFQGNFCPRHLTLNFLCLQLYLRDNVRRRYVISDFPGLYFM